MRIPLLHDWRFTIPFVGAVAALDGYANAHHQKWGDWLAAALFVSYSAYCTQNYLACREPHCAVTAPGFFLAALLMVLNIVGLAHYGYGVAWVVFVASACVGYCYEWFISARSSA